MKQRWWRNWHWGRCRKGHPILSRVFYRDSTEENTLLLAIQVLFHATWPLWERRRRGGVAELTDSKPMTIISAMNTLLAESKVDFSRAAWFFVAAEDGTRVGFTHESAGKPTLVPAAPALVGWREAGWSCWP